MNNAHCAFKAQLCMHQIVCFRKVSVFVPRLVLFCQFFSCDKGSRAALIMQTSLTGLNQTWGHLLLCQSRNTGSKFVSSTSLMHELIDRDNLDFRGNVLSNLHSNVIFYVS